MTTMKYFLFLCLLIASTAYAAEDVQSAKKSGAQLQVGTLLEVTGNRYTSSSSNPNVSTRGYWTSSAYGLVKLSCPGAYAATPALIGTATLNVSLQYQVEVNGVFELRTKTELLKLEFTNGSAQDMAYVKLEGAQLVNVQVLSSGTTIPASWPALELAVEVHTQSYEWMVDNLINTLSLTHQPTLTTDGNLKVNWTALPAAESYEIEWTYVSDQAADPTVRLTADLVEVDRFLFRSNSSRVDVKGLSYTIPMIYEKGFIICRIRAVGKNLVNGLPVLAKSKWTAEDGLQARVSDFPAANIFLYNGLEQQLNWQSSLSFAEEGKHKVVLSYHDGSSRNRQAVTRINSDERSIVGETFYDYNGRPAIQALPVPVKENTLTYFPRFNLVEGSADMTKQDYDRAEAGLLCNPNAPAFSTTTPMGAARYYSADNDFTSTGTNKGGDLLNKNLIPDAQKFPYTQTYYSPDNTGRIAAQSGVGAQYRIGTKRETRYFYGVPYQPELTRLFGPQVGYAGHYKKNTVVDPNGQTSVSYLNLDGKVVATALNGDAPIGMDALSGNMQRNISAELLNADQFSNVLSPDRLSKTYSSRFSVAPPAKSYQFNYTGLIKHYDINCNLPTAANAFNFIMDGAVNFEWQLMNTCGERVFYSSSQTNEGTTGANQNLTASETKTLPEGEYQLSKKISIDEEKLEQYWQDYLKKDEVCILKKSSFEEEELSKMNLLGCGLTCEQCITERDRLLLGTNYTEAERLSISTACDQLCDPSIGCRASLEMLRGDMSPGGQYGKLRKDNSTTTNGLNEPQYDANGNLVAPKVEVKLNNASDEKIFDAGDPEAGKIVVEDFPMSIYNPNNGLRFHKILNGLNIPKQATWRQPILIEKAGYLGDNSNNQILFTNQDLTTGVSYATTTYTDQAGDILYIDVTKITNEETMVDTYTPQITDLTKLVPVDEEVGLYKIEVKYLQNLADFEKYWQPHWSNFLIVYHPEFEYLLDCTGDQKSLAFDYKLMNTSTILQARANGMVTLAGDPLIVGATQQASPLDPYLYDPIHPELTKPNYDYIKAKNDIYFKSTGAGSTVELPYTMAQTATLAVGCPQGTESCGLPGCKDGKLDTDEEWNVFKALYIAEKQKLIRQQKLHKAVDNNYYNGCIGHPDIYTIPGGDYFRTAVTYTTEYPSIYRSCGWNWPANGGIRSWGCFDPFPVVVSRTVYPPYNTDQLCYVGEVSKYKQNQQRFYINPPAGGAGQMAQKCSSYVKSPDPTQPDLILPEACPEDIAAANVSNTVEAQRYKYEQCGLCPMAQDVELLIGDLFRAKIFAPATNKLLTCGIDDIPVNIGTTLYPALLQLNNNNPDVFWSSVLSAADKTVTGRLISAGQTLATLVLNIPTDVPVDFTTLKTPCCFSALNAQAFTLKSSYIDPLTLRSVDFFLNGTFTLPLSPCFIPPRCVTTSDTRRVLFFLNTLVMGGDAFTYKRSNLNTNSVVLNLLDAGVTDESLKLNVKEFYQPSLRALLKKDNDEVFNGYVEDMTVFEPKWSSSLTGNYLSGALTYKENNVLYTLLIEIADLPVALDKIQQFANVRPVPLTPNANDVCNGSCEKKHFLTDVLVIDANGRRYETVDIYVPALKPVICQPAVPASN